MVGTYQTLTTHQRTCRHVHHLCISAQHLPTSNSRFFARVCALLTFCHVLTRSQAPPQKKSEVGVEGPAHLGGSKRARGRRWAWGSYLCAAESKFVTWPLPKGGGRGRVVAPTCEFFPLLQILNGLTRPSTKKKNKRGTCRRLIPVCFSLGSK